MSAIEDVRIYMTAVKKGHGRFVDQLETFMERVRRIKLLAAELKSPGAVITFDWNEKFGFVNEVGRKIPFDSSRRSPLNPLYSSYGLEAIDDYRLEVFVFRSYREYTAKFDITETKCDVVKRLANNIGNTAIIISKVCENL